MDKSGTEPKKSNVDSGQKSQQKMKTPTNEDDEKQATVKPAGMSFSDWKKQKEAEAQKYLKPKPKPLAPPPPIPNSLMSIEVELPMGQSFCDGSTRGSNRSLPLYQRQGISQRNNMMHMNDWNFNTMNRNGRNNWNNMNMSGMPMNTMNMNMMNMNNFNMNGMNMNNRNPNRDMTGINMNYRNPNRDMTGGNISLNNRSTNVNDISMNMNGANNININNNGMNNNRWNGNNRNRIPPYNREANNQFSNRNSNNRRTAGLKRLDRDTNQRNFNSKPKAPVKEASKPEAITENSTPDRPPPPARIYQRTKDMVRPLMPPPIIALTPELKEEKQRVWREYRVAMKPFKNREFANAKRIVQRLGKKDPSELEEKDRAKLEKAKKEIEDYKKMLDEKGVLRDRVAAGEIAKGLAYPIRKGGENGKRAHIYEIATPQPNAYNRPTPATNGSATGSASTKWNYKSSFVSGGIMKTY